MSELYSVDEAIEAVGLLTQSQLDMFVEMEIVRPVQFEDRLSFRQVDIVRMELLCELSEDFDLHEDALAIVMSLLDQLHVARGELRAIAQAVDEEDDEVRARIGDRFRRLSVKTS